MTGADIGSEPLPTAFDRLVQLEHGRQAVAVRNIPGTLDVFDSHFPRFPVLPGMLLFESMVALAGLVLAAPGERWRLSGARVVRFRHFVRPGDQAEITVRVLDRAGQTARCTASVTVDGRPVASVRALELLREPSMLAATV
ncbi:MULTISPECIES: 3-hydroxyacyl-ACP dehydratase FabZ family protein [unclassified Frankia]|uniref:3-hydroxyacyl-ACP dehydratase FabZ family protein n=1 Tax=unclassified Frankia TaxID=2632575 RepID=UPI00202469FC